MSHSKYVSHGAPARAARAASGSEADVVSARAIRAANGSFNFEVTIRSQDRGWDHYADRFQSSPRTARSSACANSLIPDVDEQPFTRELNGSRFSTLDTVVIRAHHHPRGYDGATVQLELPR